MSQPDPTRLGPYEIVALLVFLDIEPRFDRFRADPRFADVRRRVGV